VLQALDQYVGPRARVLGFGAYFGNFSIACQLQGYRVDAADFYTSNARTFASTLDDLQKRGIGVLDFDEIGSELRTISDSTYDVVLCMGVVEHIPHAPRLIFERINRVLKPGGVLILDTPNVAYIYKRKQLMRGARRKHLSTNRVPVSGRHSFRKPRRIKRGFSLKSIPPAA
jgi:2-polyprenyl-3-methyl-5-hydroxy-6-metoxy-1,4-benzoquinol methylase